MGDEAINYFVDFVNDAQKKYKMLNINLLLVPEECAVHAVSKRDDVQIFMGNPGHYVCVNFKHSLKKIWIYDSLGLNTLYDSQKETMKVLYPSVDFDRQLPVKFVKPLTTSKDVRLSGIFAVAYATSIMLGKNPQYYKLKVNMDGDRSKHLRSHLYEMFVSGNFTVFPQK